MVLNFLSKQGEHGRARGISFPKISYTFGKNPFIFKKNPSNIPINPFVLKKSRTPFPMSEMPLVAGYFYEKGWYFIKEAFCAKVEPSGHLLPFLKIFPEIQKYQNFQGFHILWGRQPLNCERHSKPKSRRQS